MLIQDELTQSLNSLYSKMNFEGIEAILKGKEKIDPFLNKLEFDKRLGLTLLISIKGTITENLRMIEQEIQKTEPEQYFYPVSDIHVTVIDFIGGNENFVKDNSMIDKYVALMENTLKSVSSFDLKFKGIVTTDAAILAKGYYGVGLQQLRDHLRMNAIEKGIDFKERYQSLAAHATFVRFKSKIRNRENMIKVVQRYCDFDIGSMKVSKLDLVIHDWYNIKKEEIKKFVLKD